MILFGVGVVLAVVLNASVIHVAHELWADAATRQVVVAAATATSQSTAPPNLGSVGEAAAGLSAAGLPIGWIHDKGPPWGGGTWWTHVGGWVLTGLLVSLGAPFWFDLLGRLVAVRSPRPPKASEDETSAVSLVTKQGRGAPGTVLSPPTRRSDNAALGSASKQGDAPEDDQVDGLGTE